MRHWLRLELRSLPFYRFTGAEVEVDVRGRNAEFCERRRGENTMGSHSRRYGAPHVCLPQCAGRTTPTGHTPATCWQRYQRLLWSASVVLWKWQVTCRALTTLVGRQQGHLTCKGAITSKIKRAI